MNDSKSHKISRKQWVVISEVVVIGLAIIIILFLFLGNNNTPVGDEAESTPAAQNNQASVDDVATGDDSTVVIASPPLNDDDQSHQASGEDKGLSKGLPIDWIRPQADTEADNRNPEISQDLMAYIVNQCDEADSIYTYPVPYLTVKKQTCQDFNLTTYLANGVEAQALKDYFVNEQISQVSYFCKDIYKLFVGSIKMPTILNLAGDEPTQKLHSTWHLFQVAFNEDWIDGGFNNLVEVVEAKIVAYDYLEYEFDNNNFFNACGTINFYNSI